MEEKESNGKFITRQQFCKIIDLFNSHIQKPLSDEFRKGLISGLRLIETFVITKENKL